MTKEKELNQQIEKNSVKDAIINNFWSLWKFPTNFKDKYMEL